MVKFKNVILIAAIGLAVFFAGCAGTQEGKISETAKPTPVEQTPIGQTPAVQTSGYQIQVTEVKSPQDCIVYAGTKQPCSQINLEVKNNNIQSLDVKIVKNALVLTGGKQYNVYDREVGLSNLCTRQAGMEFNLNANANQNIALCYPLVHKSDSPTLNIAVMINGERKEYSFDLIKYGLTD
jgi:hypothetical protein